MTKTERQKIKKLFCAIARAGGDRAGCNDFDVKYASKWNKDFFSAIKNDKKYKNWLEEFTDEITY